MSNFMRTVFLYLIILFSIINFYCGPNVYYVKPPDWSNTLKRDSVIKSFSNVYKGWKFFIDPGHGGNDRKNRGPANDVVEADINLKLSLTLKEYLEKAGATVFLSRSIDTSVDLLDRSRLANTSGADIFISIHHNALGNNDHFTNYTSTWYHADEGYESFHPVNHDIAKYIQRDLAYVIGNNGPLSSFDGTVSDYTVYPNSGFSVLRNIDIPGVLIEGTFFSSAYEEQRLKLPEFNAIEAWGVFRGLGKYLRAGIPKLEFIGNSVYEDKKPTITIKASDQKGIRPKTIQVKIDNKETEFNFNAKDNIISFSPKMRLSNGEHIIEVIVENKNGNNSFPFKKKIRVASPPASLNINISPKTIPPMRNSQSLVCVTVLDAENNPVADGTEVIFGITSGSIPYKSRTKEGRACVFVTASGQKGFGIISAEAGNIKKEDTLFYFFDNNKYISGIVKDRNNVPICGAGVVLANDTATFLGFPNFVLTEESGKFIISANLGDSVNLNILKNGYFGKLTGIHLEPTINFLDVNLDKINNGILFDKNFVIDPRYGGKEKGEFVGEKHASDINLEIATYLNTLLKTAGANVLLARDKDVDKSEEERAKLTSDIRVGNYIRIDVASGENVNIVQYPNIPNTRFSHNIFTGLNKIAKLDTGKIISSREEIFSFSGISTISISFPSLNSKYFKSDNIKYLESKIAWGIYNGILLNNGYDEGRFLQFEVELKEMKDKGGIDALLDNCLPAVTNNKGILEFYNISGGDGKIRFLTEGNFRYK